MDNLLDPSGGYRKLDAFLMATLIQMETRRFCDRFLNIANDPKGRQFDQMTQAARSGRANIMEGSQRSSTSKSDEMRLVDVARASLVELMGDFEMVLLQAGMAPWPMLSPDFLAIAEWHLEPRGDWRDPIHDSGVYVLAQRKRLAAYLDADEQTAANTLLILCRRTVAMLTRLLQRQGDVFAERGGFRERMTKVRLEVRDETVPKCPKCGSPMRRRTAKTGQNKGRSFWGCSKWPECDGRRE